MNSTEDGNKSDSFEEPSSDESDFDFDDDTSNQSFVKSQTSQTVSEKSNNFDNKVAVNAAVASAIIVNSTDTVTDDVAADDSVQECNSKFDEPCVSTVETYDNYLGDESGTSIEWIMLQASTYKIDDKYYFLNAFFVCFVLLHR